MKRLVTLLVLLALVGTGCFGSPAPSASTIIGQRAEAISTTQDIGAVLDYFSSVVTFRFDYIINGSSLGSPIIEVYNRPDLALAIESGEVPTGNTSGYVEAGDRVVSVNGSTGTSTQAFVFSGVPDGLGGTFSGNMTLALKWTQTSGEWRVYEIHVNMTATSD